MSQSKNLDVLVVHTPGQDDKIQFRGLSLPLQFDDIAKKLVDAGKWFPEPKVLMLRDASLEIVVTDGPSDVASDGRWLVSVDQPLVQFYNEVFLQRGREDDKRSSVNEAKISSDRESVSVNGLSVRFHRTIRVPDNEKTHALPPNMGSFELFNVGEAHTCKNFPTSVISKGGAFVSMYQREAMWLSFKLENERGGPVAVKVSVGGVNALTGHPQNKSVEGIQDYLVVGGETGQLWLDGISVAPGVVRQFVAMPLGKGYTVEGQVTGKESTGGLQIDVFPSYDGHVEFKHMGKDMNIYRTPRQLGVCRGETLRMSPLGSTREWTTHEQIVLDPRLTAVELTAARGFYILVKLLRLYDYETEKTITVFCERSSTIEKIKLGLQWRAGIPIDDYRLIFNGQRLEDKRMLSDYQIVGGDIVYLIPEMRGGGGDPLHMECGFAAGGRISQQINCDPLPPIAYDHGKVQRLHISVINAAYFSQITGLTNPQSPISAQTYLKYGFPWFDLYDEHIPLANNTSSPTPLSGVQSVAQVDEARGTAGIDDTQEECGYCAYKMATMRMSPCGHVFCDECSTASACRQCRKHVMDRVRFAAAMYMPGEENGDGVEALSLDERIVKLRAGAESGMVYSFRLKEHAISSLVGEVY